MELESALSFIYLLKKISKTMRQVEQGRRRKKIKGWLGKNKEKGQGREWELELR